MEPVACTLPGRGWAPDAPDQSAVVNGRRVWARVPLELAADDRWPRIGRVRSVAIRHHKSRVRRGLIKADLSTRDGQPVGCPSRLAMVTLLEFSENLYDRRAADAVRARINRKYLLSLALTDPGFDTSVLSKSRSRLVAGGVEGLLFDTLLNLCRERGLSAKRGRQRTDATHVLGAVRSLNRLGFAIEILPAAFNALVIAPPDWLHAHADPGWQERYGRSIDDFHIPQGEAAHRACAEEVGSDGHRLFVAIDARTASGWLVN